MNDRMIKRIKTIVADTYISYDDMNGAQAFDQFMCAGEGAYIKIGLPHKTTKPAYIQEDMNDLFDDIMTLFD